MFKEIQDQEQRLECCEGSHEPRSAGYDRPARTTPLESTGTLFAGPLLLACRGAVWASDHQNRKIMDLW